ncbi:MAG: HhH-GPD family protein [Actinomycetota bacterium]
MVAEVMLQQTQTSRVVPAYPAFLELFPNVSRLARSSLAEVIRAWRGLGYNRRAVNLHRAANAIVDRPRFPSDITELRTLPGIGEYTASAIACFAFDRQLPVIDTNVSRVLGRAVLGRDHPEKGAIREVAIDLLPRGHAHEWNQALMDLGATICTPRAPRCGKCPMKASCSYEPQEFVSAKSDPPFEGSTRQMRGRIIDALRESEGGLSLRALESKGATIQVLRSLEKDGLVVLSAAARTGSPRGRFYLPG